MKYRPNEWVTWVADPIRYYADGGGYGYAVGAEWYFNFGLPGMFFGMILLGWLTAYTRNHSRDGPWELTLACLMFLFMVIIVRNDLGYPMRSTVWPIIGFLILRQVGHYLIPRTPAAPIGHRPDGFDADPLSLNR